MERPQGVVGFCACRRWAAWRAPVARMGRAGAKTTEEDWSTP